MPGKLNIRRDLRILELLWEGVSPSTIAKKFKVSRQTIYNVKRRAEQEGEGNPEKLSPRLLLDFAGSIKTAKQLTCKDIHPCLYCRGRGTVVVYVPVEDKQGTVHLSSELRPCEDCGGEGIGPYLPSAGSLCCASCLRSPGSRSPGVPEQLEGPRLYRPGKPGLKGGMG